MFGDADPRDIRMVSARHGGLARSFGRGAPLCLGISGVWKGFSGAFGSMAEAPLGAATPTAEAAGCAEPWGAGPP